MRLILIMLLLFNLGFWAWSAGYMGGESQGVSRSEFAPERTRIAGDRERAAAPAVAEKEPAAAAPTVASPTLCLAAAGAEEAPAQAFASALAGEVEGASADISPVQWTVGHWVYVGPLADRTVAQGKVRELNQLGVKDTYIMAYPDGVYISLGVFSQPDQAERQFEKIKRQGVRSAQSGPRPTTDTRYRVTVRGPAGQEEALRRRMTNAFPERDLIDCANE